MSRHFALALIVAAFVSISLSAQDSGDKNLDIHSSVGDLHVGKDADARKIGLPLYPGAHLKSEEQDSKQANLSLFTEAFGLKLLVANYESDDAPAKVIDFYREKLKKYGKVVECHTHKHDGDVDIDDDNDSKGNSELKCEDHDGPVTELKAGTQENQRVVAVRTSDSGKGSTFALIYVHTHGKRGEI